jgi:hypothetical protein
LIFHRKLTECLAPRRRDRGRHAAEKRPRLILKNAGDASFPPPRIVVISFSMSTAAASITATSTAQLQPRTLREGNPAAVPDGRVTPPVFQAASGPHKVVVGAGGFLGLGEHDVAIPYSQISWMYQPAAQPVRSGRAPLLLGKMAKRAARILALSYRPVLRCQQFGCWQVGGLSEETTMSDTTLIAVSVSTLSRKKGLAETKDCIRWYSWLGGCMATAIVMAAIVSSQDFPLLPF